MSDTDEYPAIKAPVPPAELWALWHGSGWVRRDNRVVEEYPFYLGEEEAREAADYIGELLGVDTLIPYRLIPPTP